MTQSQYAIRAAKSHWGRWATSRYLANHGVPFALYRLAKQLEAMQRAIWSDKQIEQVEQDAKKIAAKLGKLPLA